MLKARNYTLLELVVVFGIMGLIIGFAIPSFDRLVNGDKVTGGTRQLAAAIEKARCDAVVSGRQTALLFATGDDNFESGYQGRSFIPVRLIRGKHKIDTSTTTSIIDRTSLSEAKWERLPEGVIIGNIGAAGSNTQWVAARPTGGQVLVPESDANMKKSVLAAAFKNSRSGGTTSTTVPDFIFAIVFNPDGSIYNQESLRLFVTEGFYDTDDRKLTATNLGGATAAKPANTLCLEVNGFTGRCTYKDLY